MASDHGLETVVCQTEIWQAQNYWPLKGWAAPLSGTPHFSGALLPSPGADVFPEDLPPPTGWSWIGPWRIDTSGNYGSPDADGWFYAASFDRLQAMMKAASATGVAAKTSMVRKRLWRRSLQCVSEDLKTCILKRFDQVVQMQLNIEAVQLQKELALREVRQYEKYRSKVYTESLHLASQTILNILSFMKGLHDKLALIRQFLFDRMELEKRYANGLELTVMRTLDLKSVDLQQNLQFMASAEAVNMVFDNLLLTTCKANNISDSATQRLFMKLKDIAKAQSSVIEEFCRNLTTQIEDIDSIMSEFQFILTDARLAYRRSSDFCLLSETAVQNFLSSLDHAFASAEQFSKQEIAALEKELQLIKGEKEFQTEYFAALVPKKRIERRYSMMSERRQSSSSSLTNAPTDADRDDAIPAIREDFFLAVQRYRVAIRDSQEALCLLISEAMDLDMQHQILANRCHNLYISLLRNMQEDELGKHSTLSTVTKHCLNDCLEHMQAIGLPHPVLLSPFDKIAIPVNASEDGSFTPTNDKDSLRASPVMTTPRRMSSSETDNIQILSEGMYAFTALYSQGLPPAPGVVRAAEMLCLSTKDFRQLKGEKMALIWSSVYVVATSDGYLHIMSKGKGNIPDRSFYLKHCIVHEGLRDEALAEYVGSVFEVSWSLYYSKKRTTTSFVEGVLLRVLKDHSLSDWLVDLQSLTTAYASTDDAIETEAHDNMLKSLPILRGQTSKSDAERMEERLKLHQPSIDEEENPGEAANLAASDDAVSKQDAEQEPQTQDAGHFDNSTPDHQQMLTTPATSTVDEYGITLVADESVQEQRQEQDEQDRAGADAAGDETRRQSKSLDVCDQDAAHSEEIKAAQQDTVATPTRRSSGVSMRSSPGSSPMLKSSRSWIKQDPATAQFHSDQNLAIHRPGPKKVNSTFILGVTPVSTEPKPKQLIPVVDSQMPLATRHNHLIAQYQEGLLQEKARAAKRMQESKGRYLREISQSGLLPTNAEVVQEEEAAQTPLSLSTEATSENVNSDQTAGEASAGGDRSSVKKLTKIFDSVGS